MSYFYVYGASNPHVPRMLSTWGIKIDGFLSDDAKPGDEFAGVPVQRIEDAEITRGVTHIFNTVCGSTRARAAVYDRIRTSGAVCANLLGSIPAAGPDSHRPRCLYVQEGVRLQAGTVLSDNVSIHMGALIAHETLVMRHAFIGPGANVCGRVTIGEGAYIGAGAIILPNVVVGRYATVGAGAVVTRNVAPMETVKGNPAR